MDRILYESFDAVTGRSTEVSFVDEHENVLFVTHQDARPIMEHCKRLASNFDKHTHPKQDFVHVATIGVAQWAELCRLGIAYDEKKLNAWLDSREARYFRTDDARRL